MAAAERKIDAPQVVVVMGVSGSGKTTVGKALAEKLGWRFQEGDDLHSEVSRQKMAAGQALTDEDRAPWLQRLHKVIAQALESRTPLVVACSALKNTYRNALQVSPLVRFLFLTGSPALLRARIEARKGHFASPHLIESQLATLEAPADAVTLDVVNPPEVLVAQALVKLSLVPA